jgi:MFS family permease
MTAYRLSPIHLSYVVAVFAYTLVTAGRVVLPLFALDMGAKPSEIGLLYSTYFIFPLLLSLPLGMLADRHSPRGLLLLGLAIGCVGMLLPAFFHHMAGLYAAGILIGISFAFTSVLIQNLTGLLSLPAERARNFSNASLFGASTLMFGPLVAGFGIDLSGHAMACVYTVALGLVAMGLLARWGHLFPDPVGVPKPAAQATQSTKADKASARAGLWLGLRERLADRTSLRIIMIGMVIHIGQDLYQFYLPVYGHSLGLSASMIGIIMASVFIMSCLVRVWLPALVMRLGEERMLMTAFCLGALGFALTPLFQHPLALCLVATVFGIGMGCGSPVIMMLIFSHAPAGRSGETVGMRHTANNIGRAMAPPVFGFITSLAGLVPVFALSAAMMAVAAWAVSRVAPKAKPPAA